MAKAPKIATDEWETFKRGKWGIFNCHWLEGNYTRGVGDRVAPPWQAMKAGTTEGWQGFDTHAEATDYVRSEIDKG